MATLLSGCGTPGCPRQSYNKKNQIRQLEKEFEKPNLITQYYALTNATEAIKRAERDKIITGRITLINLNYNQFVARFSVRKESLDFGTEVTELGLNLATTAAGGAETKTILGAVASGVTGSKLAIDKNFFFEKTVPVLITSMNAERKTALLPIMVGIGKSTDEYPLTQALSDLDTYYFAGTFVGALQAIQADAGAKEKQATLNITNIRNKQFVTQTAQDRVGVILEQIDKLSDATAIALEKNPPFKEPDTEIDKLVALRDPNNKRLTDGATARQILKMQATMSGQRSESELAAWEAAVKSAQ
jgi:hypothetical protein